MPVAIRTIGQPSGDVLEDARRLERSTWFGLCSVMGKAADVPLQEGRARMFAGDAVKSAKHAWAKALRDLDRLKSCGGVEGHAGKSLDGLDALAPVAHAAKRIGEQPEAAHSQRPHRVGIKPGPQDLTPRRPVAGISVCGVRTHE